MNKYKIEGNFTGRIEDLDNGAEDSLSRGCTIQGDVIGGNESANRTHERNVTGGYASANRAGRAMLKVEIILQIEQMKAM